MLAANGAVEALCMMVLLKFATASGGVNITGVATASQSANIAQVATYFEQ